MVSASRAAAGPFSTQPSGPRPVGRFSVRRPPDSLDPYHFRYGRFARALKNSQLTDGETHVSYGPGHLNQSLPDPAARDTIGAHSVPQLPGESVSEFCLLVFDLGKKER